MSSFINYFRVWPWLIQSWTILLIFIIFFSFQVSLFSTIQVILSMVLTNQVTLSALTWHKKIPYNCDECSHSQNHRIEIGTTQPSFNLVQGGFMCRLKTGSNSRKEKNHIAWLKIYSFVQKLRHLLYPCTFTFIESKSESCCAITGRKMWLSEWYKWTTDDVSAWASACQNDQRVDDWNREKL